MYVWYIVFKKCWKNIVVSVEVKLVIEKFFLAYVTTTNPDLIGFSVVETLKLMNTVPIEKFK